MKLKSISIFKVQVFLAIVFFLNSFILRASDLPDLENIDWTPVYRGIDYKLDITNSSPISQRVHVIKIDLTDPDVELFGSAPKELDGSIVEALKPSTFLKRNRAQVVINGQAYYPPTQAKEGDQKRVDGTAIFEGRMYARPTEGDEDAFLVVLNDSESSVKIVKKEKFEKLFAQGKIKTGVGGWSVRGSTSLLVDEGFVRDDLIIDLLAARTAVGITKDEKTLFFVVFDGGPRITNNFFYKDFFSRGLLLKDAASYMRDLGCHYAINLDGGGASTMVIEDYDIDGSPLVLNLPSDYKKEKERAVGHHLGLFAAPLPDAGKAQSNFEFLKSNVEFSEKFKNTLIKKGLESSSTIAGYSYCNDYTHQSNHVCNLDSLSLIELSPDDIVSINDKPSGSTKGGVYRDSDNSIYFVKQGQFPVSEYMASIVFRMIMGPDGAYVKLLKGPNAEILTGSRQILGFNMQTSFGDKVGSVSESIDRSFHSNASMAHFGNSTMDSQGASNHLNSIAYGSNNYGEARLSVVMDYIGLGDRHGRNVGYVIDPNDSKISSSRVDYDHAFVFTGTGDHKERDDLFLLHPRSRVLLVDSILTYGFTAVKEAIAEIIDLPDEQIKGALDVAFFDVNAIFEEQDIDERYGSVGSVLIERKKMFAEVYQGIIYLEEFMRSSDWESYDKQELVFYIKQVFDGNGDGLLHYALRFSNKKLANFLKSELTDLSIENSLIYSIIDGGDISLMNEFMTLEMLNSKNSQGLTPLIYAIQKGSINFIKALIERGVQLNETDKKNRSALHWAVINNYPEVVDLLMSAGIDGDIEDYRGKTAIFYSLGRLTPYTPIYNAASRVRFELFEKLVNAGVSLKSKDVGGKTLLHWAAMFKCNSFINCLLKNGVSVDILDDNQQTPLFYAVLRGNIDQAILLLNNGALVNHLDFRNQTPLHFAARGNNFLLVQELINHHGANVNAENHLGQTPLFYAVAKGRLRPAKLLIAKGAKVSQLDLNGKTLLHFAVRSGNLDLVKYLLDELGLLLEPKDRNGQTPIFLAASKGHLELMKFLILKGSDFNLQDVRGKTPLHFAAKHGHTDVVNYLVSSRDRNGQTPVFLAVSRGHLSVLKALIEGGAAVDSLDINQKTLLHFAVKNGHNVIVNYLLNELKVDVDAKDKHGQTPAFLAASKGYLSILKSLKVNGSDLSIIDSNGKSLLHFAAKYGHLELVKYLVNEIKLEVDIADKIGRTPLSLAIQRNHREIANFLSSKTKDKAAILNIKQSSSVAVIAALQNQNSQTSGPSINIAQYTLNHLGKTETIALATSSPNVNEVVIMKDGRVVRTFDMISSKAVLKSGRPIAALVDGAIYEFFISVASSSTGEDVISLERVEKKTKGQAAVDRRRRSK